MRQRLRTLARNPWLALLVLGALFTAPGVGTAFLERPWAILQPSGELLLLVGVVVATARWQRASWVRRVALGAGVLLWIYLLDELVATIIVKQTPPLYDQVYLVRHLGVLLLDLWSWKMALLLAGIGVGLVLVVKLAAYLVRTAVRGLVARPLRETVPVGIAVAALLVVGTAVDIARAHKQGGTALVRWTLPSLVENVRASLRMQRDLQRGIDHSPYAAYADTYTLSRKPDVHLFLVESYGRLSVMDPAAGPRWREQVTEIQERLDASGWHAVTAYSRAPISGGRSWLAEATLLTGVFVRYEAMFQHLMTQIDRAPNLVAFLDRQGYETVLLAPKDRPRPGVETVNRYNWDQMVLALDLEYTGPQYGWGIIPDQYSLGWTQEHVLSRVDGPVFTNFHMVSSHAPWKVIPPLLDDWRDLTDLETPEDAEEYAFSKPVTEYLMRAKRYAAKKNHSYKYMGYVDAVKIDAFAAAIRYDLELLTRYLEGQTGDKIVIIMGDHQPPLISGDDDSKDVVMHVLSRDSSLLDEFRDAGFIDGMVIGRDEPTAVAHEGMFSLFVRALVRCCSEAGVEGPRHLADGVHPGHDGGAG